MMFNKETLKSKTFWGIVLVGLWNGICKAAELPSDVVEFGNYLLLTFTGVAAVDRSTKMIKGKE